MMLRLLCLFHAGHIVVDLCASESGATYTAPTPEAVGKVEINPRARRYVLPLNNSGAQVHTDKNTDNY